MAALLSNNSPPNYVLLINLLTEKEYCHVSADEKKVRS